MSTSDDYRDKDEYLLRCIEKAIELEQKDIRRIKQGLLLVRAREHKQRVSRRQRRLGVTK